MTAEKLAQMLQEDFAGTTLALARILRDFGYQADDKWVGDEVKRLQASGAPRGGPSMFIARWLKDGINDQD